MTRQRYFRNMKHAGLLRAWHAARIDHREDPLIPLMRPLDYIQREGAWADKPRSYKYVNRAQIARAILRQRGRRHRQRRRRGA